MARRKPGPERYAKPGKFTKYMHELHDQAYSLNKQLNRDVRGAKKYNWVDMKAFTSEIASISTSLADIYEDTEGMWRTYMDTLDQGVLHHIEATYEETGRQLRTAIRIFGEWRGRVSTRVAGGARKALIHNIRSINKKNSSHSAHALNVYKRARGRVETNLGNGDPFREMADPHEQTIRDIHELAVRFEGFIQIAEEDMKGRIYDERVSEMYAMDAADGVLQPLAQIAAEMDEQLYYLYESGDPNAVVRVLGFYPRIRDLYEISKQLREQYEPHVPPPVAQQIREAVRDLIREMNKMSLDTAEKMMKWRGTREERGVQ